MGDFIGVGSDQLALLSASCMEKGLASAMRDAWVTDGVRLWAHKASLAVGG